MKKIKIIMLIIMLFCIKLVSGQCLSFEYEGVNSGYDFLSLSNYSDIEICESSGSIVFGSKTFYILGKMYRNDYGQGDYIFDIQEARGYWPKIGFVKVAKDFSLIQLKFMNSVVTYNVSIKKEKGDDIILTGDYFAKDDENNKLSLKFSGNTVCTKQENDKLSYCYQFVQVKTNDLKSNGDFSYTGDLSFMKNVKGSFELTNQKLKLTWGNNEANYIITGIDNSEKIEEERREKERQENDKKNIIKINEYISFNNYSEAIALYNNLNQPNNELLNQIEEVETRNQNNVSQLILKSNLEEALIAYKKLTKKSEYLKSLFIKSYQERYKDTVLNLENKIGSSVLKKYFIDFLELHKAEKYQMQLSAQGELKIFDQNNKILATKSVENSEIATISINSFIIPVKSIYNYEVTVNERIVKLKKNNIATLYNDSISTSQKNTIEKKLYPNVIGKYTLLYEQKSFNNTLFIDKVNITNFRGIGGPINAFKSILVPGWGVKSVTGGLKSGWPTTLATYSLFTTAFIFKNLSDTNYDNYLKSTTRSENTTYYDNANMYNKTFYFFTAAGVAFWLFDVVRVSKKGFENNKTRKNTIKNLTLNIDNQSNTFAVGYKIKL